MNEAQMNQSSILSSYYEKKRKDGKRFSMRAMAKKLGVSVSLLSLILKGKRSLPIRLIDPLCGLLDIDQVDRDHILHLVLSKKGKEPERASEMAGLQEKKISSNRKLKWETLAKSETDFLTDWEDIAIFLCSGVKEFDGTPEFVAKRLFLELGLVNKKMLRLTEAGFLINKAGIFERARKTLQLRSGKDLNIIRKYHRAHLENAASVLVNKVTEADLQSRLITGMTLTASMRSIPIIKQKIQNFLIEIAELSGDEEPDEVFQFAIQFFPLTGIGQR